MSSVLRKGLFCSSFWLASIYTANDFIFIWSYVPTLRFRALLNSFELMHRALGSSLCSHKAKISQFQTAIVSVLKCHCVPRDYYSVRSVIPQILLSSWMLILLSLCLCLSRCRPSLVVENFSSHSGITLFTFYLAKQIKSLILFKVMVDPLWVNYTLDELILNRS